MKIIYDVVEKKSMVTDGEELRCIFFLLDIGLWMLMAMLDVLIKNIHLQGLKIAKGRFPLIILHPPKDLKANFWYLTTKKSERWHRQWVRRWVKNRNYAVSEGWHFKGFSSVERVLQQFHFNFLFSSSSLLTCCRWTIS